MKINFNTNAFDWGMTAKCGGSYINSIKEITIPITDITLLTKELMDDNSNTKYFLQITTEQPQLIIKLGIGNCAYKEIEFSPKDRDALLCELIKWLAR